MKSLSSHVTEGLHVNEASVMRNPQRHEEWSYVKFKTKIIDDITTKQAKKIVSDFKLAPLNADKGDTVESIENEGKSAEDKNFANLKDNNDIYTVSVYWTGVSWSVQFDTSLSKRVMKLL